MYRAEKCPTMGTGRHGIDPSDGVLFTRDSGWAADDTWKARKLTSSDRGRAAVSGSK
jgi:hypothetical protein